MHAYRYAVNNPYHWLARCEIVVTVNTVTHYRDSLQIIPLLFVATFPGAQLWMQEGQSP